jgi:hypothetical protein
MNTLQIFRWVSRILSLSLIILIILFLSEPANSPSLKEIFLLAFFPLGLVLGYILSYFKELLGSVIAITSLILFFIIGYYNGANYFSIMYFYLFLIPAFINIAIVLFENINKNKSKLILE